MSLQRRHHRYRLCFRRVRPYVLLRLHHFRGVPATVGGHFADKGPNPVGKTTTPGGRLRAGDLGGLEDLIPIVFEGRHGLPGVFEGARRRRGLELGIVAVPALGQFSQGVDVDHSVVQIAI